MNSQVELDAEKLSFFKKTILRWYGESGRVFPWRKSRLSNYKRIVSEVLLQRTKAETVASFFDDFVAEFPGWRELSAASNEELQDNLKPIGLWRRRAESLKALSAEMARRGGRFPVAREDIEALPGVGQYIANSILLFVHGLSEPLLDVNMARVLERYFGPRRLADIRFDNYLQGLARETLIGVDPIRMNWAVLDFAARICKARTPLCGNCPLADHCQYYLSSTRHLHRGI